ncbi:MAG: imelysin family protein [Jhaorihella sp.]
MIKRLISAFLCICPAMTAAEPDPGEIVAAHVLPGYEALAAESARLDAAASADCRPGGDALQAAYRDAFDAWMRVSHLRFGPSERNDRAFALAFWPDDRGSTPKTLHRLVQGRDPAIADAAAYAAVSVAARGFYALEFLLFDPGFADPADADYVCQLIRAVSADIAANAAAILTDWRDEYAGLFAGAGGNETYRSREEAIQELYKALTGGLQFTAETRLGRPLGTFERPRPARAEARRSGRSLRHVVLSLEATRELALALAEKGTGTAGEIAGAFANALEQAERLDGDPVFAGVAEPQGRLRVEVLQQRIDAVREAVGTTLGAELGVAQGFNALDGD